MESVSDSLFWNMHQLVTSSGRSFCRDLAVPLLLLLAQRSIPVLLLRWCPSSLSSSPCVKASLWVRVRYLLHALETVLGDTVNLLVTGLMDVPSWRNCTTCASWLGCKYRLMLPVLTRTLAGHKTREQSVRKVLEPFCDGRTALKLCFNFWD